MSQCNKHLEASLKREIARIYKETFGKGPDTTTVKIYENIIFIKFDGGLTHLEQALLTTDEGSKIVRDIREELTMGPDSMYIPVIEQIVKCKLDQASFSISSDEKTIFSFMVFKDHISSF